MAFDLKVEGLAAFARLDRVLAQRKIARDPLSGVVDGSNRVFYTNYYPILSSGSLYVYVAGVAVAGTYDADTGEITTGSAPATQPVATYTFIPHTTSQQLSFLLSGFQEMELRWPRSWVVKDASGNDADENSANLYVQDGSGGDPLTGKTAQIAFFLTCCRYSYLMAVLTGAANTDYLWRETVRGMSVDKTKRPGNLAQAIGLADQRVKEALAVAQDAYYTDGSHYGGFVGSPVTEEYALSMEWQTSAEDNDNRSLRGTGSVLPLNV